MLIRRWIMAFSIYTFMNKGRDASVSLFSCGHSINGISSVSRFDSGAYAVYILPFLHSSPKVIV